MAGLAGRSLAGIVVPKVSSREEVDSAVAMLGSVGLHRAAVIPLIETAVSLSHLDDIAAAPRVCRLMIGEMDLGAELGIAPSSAAWISIRVRLVVASAAAGLPAPVGSVDADFQDLDRLRSETRLLYDIGYRSRAAIHPVQIPIFAEALTPGEEEITRAHDIVETYAAAVKVGRGAVVDADGRMIDEAVVKSAQRLLDLAEQNSSQR